MRILSWIIAQVWLVNGFVCKVLGLVPRHELIVARILGSEHSRLFTVLIGLGEIIIGLWVFNEVERKWCAIVQILLIATMNIIEFILAPDLLLFGKMNALFALILIVVVYYHGFVFQPRSANTKT